MPMLLGTKGNDILSWRASAELVSSLKEELARSWQDSPASEAQSFLERYIGAIDEELQFETRLSGEFRALEREIEEAGSPGELPAIAARYREAVATHFKRRRSVLALYSLANTLHDRLLLRTLALAEERMIALGQGSAPPYALLVSGDRGRGEQTLYGANRYFLLHEEFPPHILLYRRQVLTALLEAGLSSSGRPLWHGGLEEWRAEVASQEPPPPPPPPEEFLAALPPFAAPQRPPVQQLPQGEGRHEILADLSLLAGNETLGAQALSLAGAGLLAERYRDDFFTLARRTCALPLAQGRFGRWRLEKSGEQRGLLNLGQYALGPLVRSLRVLALYEGISAPGSVERIQRLLEGGVLDVELAERLLQGYQTLMQLKVLLEIRGEAVGPFLNPEEFSPETESRFRSALDALITLQKIGYQKIVAQV